MILKRTHSVINKQFPEKGDVVNLNAIGGGVYKVKESKEGKATLTEFKCSECGAAHIDNDLTVEADGTRLCGKCWLEKGVAEGRFRVQDCKESME